MTHSVRFHPLATAEVVEAQLWYENRVNGLGDRFLGALRTATTIAAERPKVGTPTRTNDVGEVLERKASTPGFPYVVVYRTTDSDLEILAVHHERRRPDYWADRTTEKLDAVGRKRPVEDRPSDAGSVSSGTVDRKREAAG